MAWTLHTSSWAKAVCQIGCIQRKKDCDTTHCAYSLLLEMLYKLADDDEKLVSWYKRADFAIRLRWGSFVVLPVNRCQVLRPQSRAGDAHKNNVAKCNL